MLGSKQPVRCAPCRAEARHRTRHHGRHERRSQSSSRLESSWVPSSRPRNPGTRSASSRRNSVLLAGEILSGQPAARPPGPRNLMQTISQDIAKFQPGPCSTRVGIASAIEESRYRGRMGPNRTTSSSGVIS